MRSKIFVLFVLAVIAIDGAPLEADKSPQVTRYEYEHLPDNAYRFAYETSDGQTRDEYGSFKKVGDQRILVVTGKYSFIGSDGKEYKVRYIADEKGYRASGEHLPNTGTEVDLPGTVTIEEAITPPALSPAPPIAQLSPSVIATLAG